MKQSRAHLDAARREVTGSALSMFGVNGVGVGYRTTRDAKSDELCVRVMVTRKRRESYLNPGQVLPKAVHVDGAKVSVDVVQAGPFFPLALLSLADEISMPRQPGHPPSLAAPGVYNGRYRPATSGVSFGHVDITAGTLGCLATDRTDGRQVVVSNNHVLANVNQAAAGDAILQPGPIDGGTAPDDVVARLKRFVPINLSGNNRVDAAIATPTTASIVVNRSANPAVPPISASHRVAGLLFAGDCTGMIICCLAANVAAELQVDFPGGIAAALPGMVVEKVGRTTGWTVNQVQEVQTTARINYGTGSPVRFSELFTIPSFGQPGDSGSAVLRAQYQ